MPTPRKPSNISKTVERPIDTSKSPWNSKTNAWNTPTLGGGRDKPTPDPTPRSTPSPRGPVGPKIKGYDKNGRPIYDWS